MLADEVAVVLGPWLVADRRGRPYLTWKYAATLDGRTAAADGTSQWITGAAARRDVHRERHTADAVIVGIGTVLADDARLTVRDWPAARQPLRVVVDTDARTPTSARVLDDAATTLIAVADDVAPEPRRASVPPERRHPVPRVAASTRRRPSLALSPTRGLHRVLLEGGATLGRASFLRAGLVDRVVGYPRPALLGAGSPLVADLGVSNWIGGDSGFGRRGRIAWAPTSGSSPELRRSGADVHRHRRRARRGDRHRAAADAARTHDPRPAGSTTCGPATRSPSTASASPSSSQRRAGFTADVMRETLRRSSLGALRGRRARSTSSARSRRRRGSAATSCRATSTASARSSRAGRPSTGTRSTWICPASLARYVVEKGSITVDGVSLTVVSVGEDRVTVSLIPATLARTTAGPPGRRRPGQPRGRRHSPSTSRRLLAVPGHAGPTRDPMTVASATSSAPSPTSRPARPVVVVDDEDRENEGDLIFAAEMATPGAGRVHGALHLRATSACR